MNPAEITRARLAAHQLAGRRFATAKEVVGWMGAMQAQDYAMCLWAVGIRLPGSTVTDIENALDAGEILRTHVLRPTWHLVSAEDITWMLALTAPHIKARMKSRRLELGLSESVLSTSINILEKSLQGGKHATRQALIAAFEQGGIATSENRASHLLMSAELEGLICSGPILSGRPSYALLAERVPQAKTMTREEALAALAERYFSSHGPAAYRDFAWWSGLPAAESRLALELAKDSLVSETIEAQTCWWHPAAVTDSGEDSVHLLPAYDEYIIGYQERSAVLPDQDFKKAVSSNGVFWPVVLVEGQVRGVWKRAIKKEGVVVEVEWFDPGNHPEQEAVESAAAAYAKFLGKRDLQVSVG
jgi:hypothetical protein